MDCSLLVGKLLVCGLGVSLLLLNNMIISSISQPPVLGFEYHSVVSGYVSFWVSFCFWVPGVSVASATSHAQGSHAALAPILLIMMIMIITIRLLLLIRIYVYIYIYVYILSAQIRAPQTRAEPKVESPEGVFDNCIVILRKGFRQSHKSRVPRRGFRQLHSYSPKGFSTVTQK